MARDARPASSGEDPEFLSRQLITYIGNKRALLGQIAAASERVKRRLGKSKLRVFDAFSGSGIVSRFFKAHASYVASNDIEDYAATVSRCFLRNRSGVDLPSLRRLVDDLNERVSTAPFPPGFIEELYAPRDDAAITKDDRVFYTRANARRLDNYRRLVAAAPDGARDLLLGPLLGEASVHANTAGVFKGFYKNRQTGIGQFGGSGADALGRITGEIRLEPPVLSRHECEVEVFQSDAAAAARGLRDLDLAYLDPPYNQHPYGSNYFMLNLLVRYERPERVSRVSGIPAHWRRSGYNVRARSLPLLRELVAAIDAPFLLVSFSDEGFVAPSAMLSMLEEAGKVETFETRYNAFRGSRSFANRPLHVTERLFLVERR
ncbi:MAG: DNA modification methylase [Candidatus Latescibacterota bacterium]|jgi:adenine-specific DNA-methyltransferase|nr:MAG: DNA modification methylase [Candidatus Latescibacterota bacterium]